MQCVVMWDSSNRKLMQLLPTQKLLELGAGAPGSMFCAGPSRMTQTLDHVITLTSQRMCKRTPIHRAWHPANTQNMSVPIIALISSSPKSSSKAMSHCFPMCQRKGLACMLSQDLGPGFILGSLPSCISTGGGSSGTQAPG